MNNETPNAPAARVDVLAVMARMFSRDPACNANYDEYREARAAVAELIEAAEDEHREFVALLKLYNEPTCHGIRDRMTAALTTLGARNE